jgi:hypothetical protein
VSPAEPAIAREPVAVTLGPFACLAYRFRVRTADPSLAAEFGRVYSACAASDGAGGAPATIEVGADGGGAWVRAPAALPRRAADRDAALVEAMTVIDGETVGASAHELLVFHASAAMLGGRTLLLVGPPGAGKTTLAAALTLRGWTYVGDEAIGIDPSVLAVHANPKPLKVDGTARGLLGAMASPVRIERGSGSGEALLAPAELGRAARPGPIGALPFAVVEIECVPGTSAALRRVSRPDVAMSLAGQCFNFRRWGAAGLDAVVSLARATTGYRLEFGDLDAAAGALAAVVS